MVDGVVSHQRGLEEHVGSHGGWLGGGEWRDTCCRRGSKVEGRGSW